MKQFIGRVKKVFIPEDNDYYTMNNVGFVIDKNNKEEIIVLKQDTFTSNILKEDLVLVTKQVIDGREFVDIEKIDGVIND